jgi:hypothetical protein
VVLIIVRLLANLKEIEEPFEKDQIGSSAMAYKVSSASFPLDRCNELTFSETLCDASVLVHYLDI